MIKNLIVLSLVLMFSCEPSPSYDYNASNIISYLRDYNNEVDVPSLMVYRDSTFSIRKNCYRLMNDNRVYLNHGNSFILMSKEELKVLFEQVRQEYLIEKKMNPVKSNKKDYNSPRHYYRTEYSG